MARTTWPRDSSAEPKVTSAGRRGVAGPGSTSAEAALERLHSQLQERLDRLESLARSTCRQADTAELQALRSALDSERAQLDEESASREHEWRTRLEELEHDRRRLAEAWEQLEREVVQDRTVDQGPLGRIEHRSVASTGSDVPHVSSFVDPVSSGILRQFESLRQDVRRRSQEPQAKESP